MPDAKAASLFALTTLLQPLRRSWFQAASQTFEATGLSMSMASIILITSRQGGGLTQAALADEIGVNPGAMARSLDQAESSGWVVRQTSETDRRSKRVYLTELGQEMAAEVEARVAELRETVLGDLPEDEVNLCVKVLRQFDQRLASYLQKPGQGKNALEASVADGDQQEQPAS
ncbi:MarR family winged helix-turn-helix transcriptional regulator [Pokkaliibacter sp. CJK22405]|uniref:MarR family winged helix-turn-helix transcriptional regulator n=1 Tax=Pokkaliibacter sp. CJK22405 TaxID=3384615 RepID=UPI0039855F40